ncbi:MAG: Holliday junction DNA helicase RuvA [Parcubacteria group bacterium RIFCSPHIGHO2_01_FULL_45_26]|nr:MAG: Holliday junction DNA helicase RuvA [Parcubacteria group bacterium RIFCSPHIGHO2_01_FULL_45_26]
MIAELKGVVNRREVGYVVLDVGGVGYKVYVPLSVSVKSRDSLLLFTHLVVREDALDLYGFGDLETLRFFELLLRVSGVGPKSALAILSQASIPTLKQAIANGDLSYLTKVSGIGKKTAERIIIELRDRVSSEGEGDLAGVGDALEALVALGYSRRESQETLRKTNHTGLGVEEIVRKALADLSKDRK